MGLLGSGFGRALAGAGEGVASIAGKYLDQQLVMDKARALEEMRLLSEQRMDEYRNSPERRARLREEELKDSNAKYEQGLMHRVAELKNQELLQATIERENKLNEGTAGSRAAVEGVLTRTKGMNTPQVLSPGQTVTIGGQTVAENSRPTPAEASLTAYREGKGKVERLSEGAKVQLQALDKREAGIAELIDKGVSNGTLSTSANGPDGKPAPGHDQFRWLRSQQAQIALQRSRVLANEGLLDGAEDAERLLAGGATAADLEASVKQADQIGGRYAQDFRAAIEPALKHGRSREYAMESVKRDAEKTGTSAYLVDVGGKREGFGGAIWDKAAEARSRRPAASDARQEPAEVVELRKHEERVRAAQAELQTWGSRKRQADPQGFARAQRELDAAKTELRDAVDRLGIPTGIDRPAFIGPRP